MRKCENTKHFGDGNFAKAEEGGGGGGPFRQYHFTIVYEFSLFVAILVLSLTKRLQKQFFFFRCCLVDVHVDL